MDYTYAGTRAKALQGELLTENQRELLLGSKSVEEFFTNLHDTFLGPYIADHKDKKLSKVLEETINDAKKLLNSIAPDKNLMEILWIKYDFYNLKTIIKGTRAGLDRNSIKEHCFESGIYSPERLLQAFENNNLISVDDRLKKAAEEANEQESASAVDLVLNMHYLTSIRDISNQTRNSFAKDYVRLLIDIFNLRSALRTQTLDKETAVRDIFVDGGTIYREQLGSTDAVLTLFERFGGPDQWKEATNHYRNTGNLSLIEKVLEDYIADWLKDQSREIFSAAPLFSYFTAKKNNAQMIRAIHVGKVAGLEEGEIRRTLRNLYNNL